MDLFDCATEVREEEDNVVEVKSWVKGELIGHYYASPTLTNPIDLAVLLQFD